MAINFTGEFETPRSPDEVFDFLSDPAKFGRLFPDFEGMTFHDATHFTINLRVSVGNLGGSAEFAMELAEALRPHWALYKGAGTALGSQITMSAGFDLSPQPDGTRVAWQGEANIAGKLASLGPMLEPVVKKNLTKLIAALQWALYMASSGAVQEAAASQAGVGAPTEADHSASVPAQSAELVPPPPAPTPEPQETPAAPSPLADTQIAKDSRE